jgi:hypothetical protein
MIETLEEAMRMTQRGEGIAVRGFSRVQLMDPKDELRPVGDSGWLQNQITNEGVRNFLARLLGGIASSSQVTHFALGTGSVPASDATSLDGEQSVRTAVNAATSGSTAVQFTATFSSAGSFVTATKNLSNIGLFGISTAGGGTLFAGNTYASSSCATNQNVNVTYTITFSRP